VRGVCGHFGDRQGLDCVQIHGSVAVQALVFWRHLAGSVLKLPGRVGQNGRELLSLGAFQKVKCGIRMVHVSLPGKGLG
jgi:hypothetical protein